MSRKIYHPSHIYTDFEGTGGAPLDIVDRYTHPPSHIKRNLDSSLNYNLFMWDFKLKKTRLILLVSILWSLVGYLLASNSVFSFIVYNQQNRYETLENPYFYIWMMPVIIYWTVLPLFRWAMKGK